jgi:hypothetical protein
MEDVMKKTHIRSYRIIDHGDVEVVDRRDGDTDLSIHYEGAPRDRGGLRLEASLDVFRFEDGRLVWSASPNGQDTESAAALSLLLHLFCEDVLRPVGAPRSF